MATATRVANNEVPVIAAHTYEATKLFWKKLLLFTLSKQSNVRYSQKSSEDMKRLKEFAKLGYKTIVLKSLLLLPQKER